MSNRSSAPAGGTRRRGPWLVCVVAVLGALTFAPRVHAQEAPPPIAVPTDPVPQGPPPTPTTKPKPKPGAPTATAGATTTNGGAPPPIATSTSGGDLAPTGGSTGGGAGTTSNTPSTGSAASPTINNEGTFKISGTKGPGVVGTGATPKPGKAGGAKSTGKTGKLASKTKAPVPIAEWPGFRMTDDGGSEVMVELSMATAAPTEHRAAGTITYAFPGAVVTKRNNKNPLLTIHFNTPVLDARLVPAKGELHLVVELRPGLDLAAVTGMRPATEGQKQQFFVKFPAGSYLPPTDDDGKTPNAKTEQGKPAGKPKGASTSGAPSDSGAKTGPTP